MTEPIPEPTPEELPAVTDQQIIEAIGGPYHCVDCLELDERSDDYWSPAIVRLRALFQPPTGGTP